MSRSQTRHAYVVPPRAECPTTLPLLGSERLIGNLDVPVEISDSIVRLGPLVQAVASLTVLIPAAILAERIAQLVATVDGEPLEERTQLALT